MLDRVTLKSRVWFHRNLTAGNFLKELYFFSGAGAGAGA